MRQKDEEERKNTDIRSLNSVLNHSYLQSLREAEAKMEAAVFDRDQLKARFETAQTQSEALGAEVLRRHVSSSLSPTLSAKL
jgi:hypothetical protein